ncbi:hypothetical protein IV203_036594 [Nitzschia inconspicua]|uniref:Uncharacterized protein n=1 Tax=Nitzschia inconspicua TaxID=303405 RepID=A0A9K3LG98_9STRA|nr:hypothetical protein IV203_036594 [Nitzschia inconspicua]
MMASVCGIRVVLFCKGRGADPKDYRPNSDESQWWGRRDALVRCVTAFLFGPSQSSVASSREMVLLFDDDAAVLEMSRTDHVKDKATSVFSGRGFLKKDEIVPTEHTIIQLWKRAAQNPGTTIHMSGMACSIHVDPTVLQSGALKQNAGTSSEESSMGLDSKRQILEYLQKHCSMEFLRNHRLNSGTESILRKSNRDALLKVWREWNEAIQKGGGENGSNGGGRRLQVFFHDMLQVAPQHVAGRTKVVAGLLHESCPEFPCFNLDISSAALSSCEPHRKQQSDSISYFVCLFLGAVRDMTMDENRALHKLCHQESIPCVGIRFGTVPEFTSKILSLLAFHQFYGALGTSIHRLVSSTPEAQSKSNSYTLRINEGSIPPSTCLNVICTVPISSKDISTDLEKRNRVSWCLVRVVVCTLWRSKLASSKIFVDGSEHSPHTNILYLVFDDGIVLCLTEAYFVSKLASDHKAAPSENQILGALVQEIKHQTSSNSLSTSFESDGSWSKKEMAKNLISHVLRESRVPVTCSISVDSTSPMELVHRFYRSVPQELESGDLHFGLLLILKIEASSTQLTNVEQSTTKDSTRMHRRLMSACRKLNIPMLQQSIVKEPCCDHEAATIIALQHFCYQNRVYLNTSSLETSSKRKRKRKLSKTDE